VRMFNNVIGNGRWFDGYICGLVPPPTKVGVLDINPEGCSTPLAHQGGGR
jgi:phospholipid/cholesterol/gamma-HCH transport system substrate-binding protein